MTGLSLAAVGSLGDAFRMEFSGVPKEIPGAPGLRVMETDPALVLQKEIGSWQKMAKEAGMDKLITEVGGRNELVVCGNSMRLRQRMRACELTQH